MRISPYGTRSVMTTALVCAAIFIFGILLHSAGGTLFSASSVVYLAFVCFFYRDPERACPDDPEAILAPADGKVLLIRPVSHPQTGRPATLVSIFMSPLNVHVNRIPVDGTVTHRKYLPGKFLMAFDHRSMSDNERTEICIESTFGPVWFCQVSGFLARRIVCNLEAGDHVRSGNRFGMIKFGSRVDIVLPDSLHPAVTEGSRTVAGQTVIARRQPGC